MFTILYLISLAVIFIYLGNLFDIVPNVAIFNIIMSLCVFLPVLNTMLAILVLLHVIKHGDKNV